MNKVILFLLESSVILGVLYLIYYLLLRKEASFNFNRFFLLGALACSLALPLISVDFLPSGEGVIDQPIRQLSNARSTYQGAVSEWSAGVFDQGFTASSVDSTPRRSSNRIVQTLLVIYVIGLVAMIFRLLWMVSWILTVKAKNPKEVIDGVSVVKVPYRMAPFSFLNRVFVSEEMVEEEEFLHILAHEKTHIQQRHSLDLIIVQLLSAVLWFNPAIWWLSKSLKTTHEYIADRKMIKQGYSLVEYQTLLLRQLISNNSFGLVHNFNLSFIKKRITMMKIQKLGDLGKFKVATVTAITMLFSVVVIQCNSKLEDQSLAQAQPFSVDLPVIENNDYVFDVNMTERLDIVIQNDKVFIDNEEVKPGNFGQDWKDVHPKTQVVLQVDKGQSMKLVHEVQEQLRKLDLRLIVYETQSPDGNLYHIPLMLPPAPGSNSRVTVPELTDAFIQENGIQMLELKMGSSSEEFTDRIYNSLHDPSVDKSLLVVRGRYTDGDTYGNYLTSLSGMKQAYYDFYEERAQELYGKSFYDISREQKVSEEAKSQYHGAREGVPMAIVFERI